jgi:hypothetical protein
MTEFYYLLLVPTLLKIGDWYKEEIKEYFKTFNLKENWHHLAMFLITICIIVMTIAIVKYKP